MGVARIQNASDMENDQQQRDVGEYLVSYFPKLLECAVLMCIMFFVFISIRVSNTSESR